MFHIIFILRNYLLMSQTELAQRASISQRDLASMETEKYFVNQSGCEAPLLRSSLP